jgi:hypothetical protein
MQKKYLVKSKAYPAIAYSFSRPVCSVKTIVLCRKTSEKLTYMIQCAKPSSRPNKHTNIHWIAKPCKKQWQEASNKCSTAELLLIWNSESYHCPSLKFVRCGKTMHQLSTVYFSFEKNMTNTVVRKKKMVRNGCQFRCFLYQFCIRSQTRKYCTWKFREHQPALPLSW